jgi:hypothetical protein
MVMKEKMNSQHLKRSPGQLEEDGLGPNSDIGARLRALYGAIQDESIPDKFLDLLEKLDQVESQSKRNAGQG